MNEKRLNQIMERKAAIVTEIDGADEARMKELEEEVIALDQEEKEIRSKLELKQRLGNAVPKPDERGNETELEERAKKFAETNKTKVNTRALLVSGGTIAKTTEASNVINDMYGVEVSALVDMVYVEDCTGMGTHRVPYVSAGSEANEGIEGSVGTESNPTFGYVDLTPKDFDVLSYVSKQVKKQSPLMYEEKVKAAARTALRKKASKAIVDAIYASTLCTSKEYAKDTTNGVKIGATTLREIAFAYGGDEGIGGGVLILSKADLIAFGDVRGTNEKKAVYEITPDAGNENTGTIKDGGLVVKYVINSNCNTFHGNKNASKNTMIYGNPKYCEMDTWGDIEIATSEDYKFAEGLLTVRGETLLDADVTVKNGFVVVKIGA